METKIKIEVSNRHVHLSKETYDKLFDTPIAKVKDLSQTGEFVSDKTVTLKTDNFEIKNVKVLGPLRSYDQVEISHNDALKFKINPPVRASGDVKGAHPITIETDKASLVLESAILAQRHIHMNEIDAKKYQVTNGQAVKVRVSGPRSGEMDAYIKISESGVMLMHIDTDDANGFIIQNGDEGDLII